MELLKLRRFFCSSVCIKIYQSILTFTTVLNLEFLYMLYLMNSVLLYTNVVKFSENKTKTIKDTYVVVLP